MSTRRRDSTARPSDDSLFWRDEILQVLWWLRGEGLGSSVTAPRLAGFLGADAAALEQHLRRLVVDGLLAVAIEGPPAQFAFTDEGAREGARRFADEFRGMVAQGHGDCGPDCPICRDEPRDSCAHCSGEDQPA